ncbi:HAD family hydrolase [Acidithiobacillus sp. AMEEHan]|uniref:HAD family hydrolase n=1 Tax=Acidithiobacillus sp. AMEEHan TaxID=2994951 RepID=UPI0027E495A6|nr:HAD family hydrolase [Acidithiobacillus sp. AMEEHan]
MTVDKQLVEPADHPQEKGSPLLYLVLISIHGLIRGQNIELGRDADTGGQILYVLELLHALAAHPKVSRVDLLTRQIIDPRVSDDYQQEQEILSDEPKAHIIRLPAGPEEYLPKESLWPYLDSFSDHAIEYLRKQAQAPSVIHSHYADAGYVGMRLALQLGVPLVHTAHSLGRSKRQHLLAFGESETVLEEKYRLSHRIHVEEEILSTAALVVASTQDEIDSQYGMYDRANPERMRVIPPGVDLSRFAPVSRPAPPIVEELKRFLRNAKRPPILALSRPDERKNIAGLIHAYGKNPELQARANLVIIAGNREDIRDMPAGLRQVLTEMLFLIDCYNLYGKVAYPRQHSPEDVPDLYRWAADLGGVFINPALTEPFGLTLIEAAACGLPVLATENGGPKDIITNCNNGLLINPLDTDEMSSKLLAILNDARNRRHYAQNGVAAVRRHYTWPAHVEQYLEALRECPMNAPSTPDILTPREPRVTSKRLLFLGVRLLDQYPIGPADLAAQLFSRKQRVALGLVTMRPLSELLMLLKERGLGVPELLITGAGTYIHYGTSLTRDQAWSRHIAVNWQGDRVYDLLAETAGVHLASRSSQGMYTVHGFIHSGSDFGGITALDSQLHAQDIPARVVAINPQEFLVIPQRASLGFAVRYVADRHDIPLEHVLVVGSPQADLELLGGNILAAQIGGGSEGARLSDDVYSCQSEGLAGILEAISHYQFLDM